MGDKQAKEEDAAARAAREEEEDEQDGYFSGYAHFGIHHDMIAVQLIQSGQSTHFIIARYSLG